MKPQSCFLPLLPNLNDLIAAAKRRGPRNWNGYAALKRGWQDRLVAEIKAQRLQPVKTYPVRLIYEWREPNRRRDLSNVAAGGRKYIEDALVAAGVLRGDGWRDVAGWTDTFTVDSRHPGVYVELQEALAVNEESR